MARLADVHPAMRAALLAMECPTFDTQSGIVPENLFFEELELTISGR
jgi:hypothetical protein